MAKLFRFILPLLVFLLSGFNSFSEKDTVCHFSTETLSLESNHFESDRLVKVGAFQKKGLGHEDYLIEAEEKEEEVSHLENHLESGNSITALFYEPSFQFSTDSVYNGKPVSERLLSNKRYILFAVFRI